MSVSKKEQLEQLFNSTILPKADGVNFMAMQSDGKVVFLENLPEIDAKTKELKTTGSVKVVGE